MEGRLQRGKLERNGRGKVIEERRKIEGNVKVGEKLGKKVEGREGMNREGGITREKRRERGKGCETSNAKKEFILRKSCTA